MSDEQERDDDASEAAFQILLDHWLIVDMADRDRIVGCHCGYQSAASKDEYDFGDDVIHHILETARAKWVTA